MRARKSARTGVWDRVAMTATCVLLLGCFSAGAQDDDVMNAFRQLPTAKGIDRVDVLHTLGRYYLDKPGSEKNDIDSAMIFFSGSRALADDLHYVGGSLEALEELGKCYFELKDGSRGAGYFRQAIEFSRKKGTKRQKADCLVEIGTWCSVIKASLFPERDSCLEQAIVLFKELDAKDRLSWAWKMTGLTRRSEGKQAESDSAYLQALEIDKSIDPGSVPSTYQQLAINNRNCGRLQQALKYALESIRHIDDPSKDYAPEYYQMLGIIYEDLERIPESLNAYRKACDAEQLARHHVSYLLICQTSSMMISLGQARQALELVSNTIRRQGISNDLIEHLNASIALGNCYNALRDYSRAEANYLEAVKWTKELNKHYDNNIAGFEAIAKFYNGINEPQKARPYLLYMMQFANVITINDVMGAEEILSKADSAAGNYLSALRHANRFKVLSDSLFNDRKAGQLQEIELQYETAKKEKDFQLLKSRSDLQQRELMETVRERKFIYAGIGMLLVILGLGYNRYRLKQRSNRQLQEQQGIISQKNIHLEDLVQEKEWLLREIHHRVKNNLQIVISLLNTQSAFIDNEAALAAIRESRHRMQAMSMIHQKLYQEGDITLINMQEYIREFVRYLEESFNASSRIRFDLSVCQVELDVSQAIPIALILNEVITNALKHAFPGDATGSIRVVLRKGGDNELLLCISDNGKGWSKDRKHDAGASFGMNLIDTLARQLEGELSIINDGGVTVALQFRLQQISDMHSGE